jgi:hypothetical protein
MCVVREVFDAETPLISLGTITNGATIISTV